MAGRATARRVAHALLRAGQEHIGRHIPYPIRTRLRRLVGLPAKPPPRVLNEDGLLPWRADDQAPGGQFDILIFPIIAWNFRFQRPQQLARQLARKGHRVFWIDPDALLHGENPHDGAAPLLTEVEENVIRVSPGVSRRLNVYRDTLDETTREALLTSLHHLVRESDIASAALLVQLPFWSDAALALRAPGFPLVYDCMDDHADFETNSDAMTSAEAQLAAGADRIVVTASALESKFADTGPEVVRIPNGCDAAHFAPHTPPPARPERLRDVTGPIIGYYGAISAWFDFDLIRHAVAAHPDWQFVLIGSTFGAPAYDDLAELPNVHFVGEVPYEELPTWVACFDVATIPFQLTPLIRATDPVKAYEYLAAGLPVVASDLPELRTHGDLFRLAESPAAFTAHLENALAEGSARADERRAFAAQHTWEARSEVLLDTIRESWPRVSVVLVTWNNLGFTQQCVDSLRADESWPAVEWIFVDNGSTDDTPGYLRTLATQDSRVRVIFNQDNRGFAAANNQGLEAARGEILVLLNNDTVVPPGWLARLVRNLHGEPDIGLIGPVTNNVWNEARQDAEYDGAGGLAEFARGWAREHRDERYPIEILAMYCAAMPRAVHERVGALDERFGIGMFEDDDYSHRIRAAGYRVVCAEEVYIHHAGRASFRKLADARYRALHEENRRLYEEKWAWNWRPHEGDRQRTRDWAREIQTLVRACEAKGAPGVVIFPPNIGWAIDLFQRPHQLAMALGRMGWLVFFCLHDYDAGDQPGLREIAPGVHLAAVPGAAFDGLRGAHVFAMPYNGYEASCFADATVIYESVDEIEVFGGDTARLRREHERLVGEADVVVATADQLLEGVREARPDAILAPNGVDFGHFAIDAPACPKEMEDLDGPIIGYYGALARWVDYDLLKAAAAARPDWNFILIGPDHDGTAAASGLGTHTNLHLFGARPYAELPAWLAHFDVATIPFRVDRVTTAVSPLKLFEYLAGGCPVVTTDLPECARIPQVRVARDSAEWIAQIEEALATGRGEAVRRELQEAARAHTWEARAETIMQAAGAARRRRAAAESGS